MYPVHYTHVCIHEYFFIFLCSDNSTILACHRSRLASQHMYIWMVPLTVASRVCCMHKKIRTEISHNANCNSNYAIDNNKMLFYNLWIFFSFFRPFVCVFGGGEKNPLTPVGILSVLNVIGVWWVLVKIHRASLYNCLHNRSMKV